MSDLRHNQMMDFLNNHLAAGFSVESLPGDASFRRYHRIFVPMTGAEPMTYLLMDAPPQKESVTEFVQVAELLSQAVNVPDIIARDVDKGFLLLQDFGTVEFAHLIADDVDNKDHYYKKALQTLVQLQTIPTTVELPAYSDEKLSQEIALFIEWFLPELGVHVTPEAQVLWQNLTAKLIEQIQSQPKVVVHRDYHSRNLMADKGSQALGVIDFQDAVIGAYTYDLVSLVRDAYIDEDEPWVTKKIQEFYQQITTDVDLGSFIAQTNIMGVQRHLKVLGIFVRLAKRDGKQRYLQDIPKVFRDLVAELEWLSHNTPDQVYGQFLDWIVQIVTPAYQEKFPIKSKG